MRPVFKVKVEIIGSKENSYIEETYMTEFRADERNHRYQLQSGTAAASILLHEDRLTEKTRLEVKKQLHLCNAENGYLAMKCLRILFTGKCTLRITNLDTGELLKDFPIEGASSQENYQALEDFCKFIVRINENFKLDLRIPNPPCQLPFITAAWIYHGIVYGEIERRSKEPIKWTVSAAHARSVLNALRTGEEITFEDPAHTVELLGAQINLGLMRGRFVNPQLVDSLEELAKKIESLPDEEEVELAILCDSIVDVFPVGPLPPAQR